MSLINCLGQAVKHVCNCLCLHIAPCSGTTGKHSPCTLHRMHYTLLLTCPQHSSFKECLPKAQGFPVHLGQCQTSVLSHHLQDLSLTAELVLKKLVSVSRGTLTQGHLASMPISIKKCCLEAHS